MRITCPGAIAEDEDGFGISGSRAGTKALGTEGEGRKLRVRVLSDGMSEPQWRHPSEPQGGVGFKAHKGPGHQGVTLTVTCVTYIKLTAPNSVAQSLLLFLTPRALPVLWWAKGVLAHPRPLCACGDAHIEAEEVELARRREAVQLARAQ